MQEAAIADGKRQWFNLWLTLLLIWLAVNASLAPAVVVVGALLAALLAVAFAPFARVYTHIQWSPRVLLYVLRYLLVFSWELIKANLNVARLVLSPRIRIQPGIVEVRTRLKSPLGRLVLANSITLTPGTLVVDVRDDTLFIHWIVVSARDPEAATREIAGRFERYLEVIYG